MFDKLFAKLSIFSKNRKNAISPVVKVPPAQTMSKKDVPQEQRHDLADLQKAVNAAVEAHSAQFSENVRQLTQNLDALKIEVLASQRTQNDAWPSPQTAYR